MENNILKVVFGADRTSMENYARSASLWQYDYGQKLLIEGVTLPMAYEVHFSNKRHGNSVTVIGDDTGVDIPDEMLLSGQDVYAWVYLHSTENDGETEYMVTIPVNKRAEPTNDLPTPVQQDVIDQTIAALQAAVAKSETNVTHYPCIIDGYWYVWDAEQNAFVNTEVSGHGEKGDDGKDGNGIARIELNPDYTLTFYYTNGTSYTTGSIRGAQGSQGEPGPKGDKGDKGDPGKPMDIIDDTAGAGETERAWSADKLVTELGTKADKTDTVLNTTLSRGRKENTTVGQYSIAFGYDAEASGALSQAVGLYPAASGVASHAEGNSTTASGEHSHAEGSGSTASGVRSHAEGYSTVATGPNSHTEGNGASTAQGAQSAHAEGEWTQANAQASHAEGMGTRADGYYAHSEGDRTVAAGNYGHAEGSQTAADGSASHAEGYKATANGNYSHVEGDNTYASGQSSHAEGVRTEAAGLGSHAEGYYSKSTGQYAHTEGARGDIASKMYNGVLYAVGASGARSHAEGLGGIAAGTEAHAEGNGTYAIGNDSHAEGIETKAIGLSAHAEGSYTTAKAMHSHAEGYSTIASGNYSHVSGKHNVEDLNNQYVEIIGNGTGNATRSNARSLDWNGNERLRGDIYVQCNPDGTGGIKIDPSGGGDVSNKADKTDTVLLTTLSRGRKENTTVGTASFAFGENVTASGQDSHAEGAGTVASGPQAHAEGYGTTASGENAHAEGGNTYASGAHAHTEGGGTVASGSYSHAEGAGSQSTGNVSHAEGSGTRASGGGSHAEGGGTVASGGYSHAEGGGSQSTGNGSHAEGSGTQANGEYSHAEGQATKANAKESHAEGHYTVANGEASHVFGKFNVADNYSDYPEWVSGTSYAVGDLVKVTTVVSGVTTIKGYKCYTANSDTTFTESKWTRYDYLHYVEIVGNGEGPDAQYRSNARTLDWDGNERLMGDIYVECNPDGTGGLNLKSAVNEITLNHADKIITNGYVHKNGTISSSSNDTKRSGYISVKSGEVYRYDLRGISDFAVIAFFTAEDPETYVTGSKVVGNGSDNHTTGLYTVPQNGYVMLTNMNSFTNPLFAYVDSIPDIVNRIDYAENNIDNLWDSVNNIGNEITIAGYVSKTGTIGNNANDAKRSDFIPVKSGQKLYYRLKATSDLNVISFFTTASAQGYSSGIVGLTNWVSTGIYTVPSDGYIMLTNMNVFTEPTVSAYKSIPTVQSITNTDVLLQNATGRYILNFGDSVAAGAGWSNKSYAEIVATETGATLIDYSSAGKPYARYTDSDSYACVANQVLTAISEQSSKDVAIIFVEGGVNDLKQTSFDTGTMNYSYDGTYSRDTIIGASDYIFYSLRTTFPSAKIVFVMYHHMPIEVSGTYSFADINERQEQEHEAFLKVCAKWGVPVADVYAEGQLNSQIQEMANLYFNAKSGEKWNRDIAHPNQLGYRRFYMPLIRAKLNQTDC